MKRISLLACVALVGVVLSAVPAWCVSLQPGWPQSTGSYVFSSPALGDLDGEGDLEVVVGSVDSKVYAWHHDGTPVAGWPQSTGSDVVSSPALGDLDGDGDLEVVVGSNDRKVYAWHHDGTPVAGWPQTTGSVVGSSPALGDLDGDGDLEVVVGSSDSKVYAWHDDGTPVAGWPQTTGAGVYSSPALGDLDGDGDVEVVVGSYNYKVYAWHHDGTPVAGWPQTTGNWVYSSPALGDLDGDGDLEVVVGSYDFKVHAWHHDGTPVAGWPQSTGSIVRSSPALGDLDGDGDLEVVVGSVDYKVYAWTCEVPTSDLLPWPMFRHDLQRTGRHTMIGDTTLVLNSVSPAWVTVGSSGPVALTATLRRNDTRAGLAGATVAFSVDGNPVGTAATGAGGVGTLNYDPSALAPGSHRVRASFAGQTIGGIAFLASASNALTLHVPVPDPYPLVIRQLTSWPDTSFVSWAAFINYDGSRVAIESGAPLTGGSPPPGGGSDVFGVYGDGTGLRRLTYGAGGSTVMISGNGEMIVFLGRGNITGQNADGSSEVFVVSFDGSIVRQLTFSPNSADVCSGARIDHDGQWVAFISNADLTGENADHNYEAFVVRSDGTGLRQLTHEPSPSYRVYGITLSRDGQKVAFGSTSDFLGTNPDHSREVFIINRDGTGLAQVTDNPDPTKTFDAAYGITWGGDTLLIYGTANPTGQNPDGHSELFIVNSYGTGLEQLTCDRYYDTTNAMMSYDGTVVSFRSRADFTGENPDHSWEVFMMRSDGTRLTQVSRYDGPGLGSCLDRLSGDGKHIAFTSNGNQTGQNPDLSQEGFIADVLRETTLALNSVSPASVPVGSAGPVVFTATLTRNDTSAGVVGATVAFSVDGNPVGTAATGAGGVGTLNYNPSALAPGSHTVQASFAGQSIGGVTFLASTSSTMTLLVGNTPPGSDVSVEPGPEVGVTFSQVTGGGNTEVTTSSQGPPAPANFQTGDPPLYYDITTTATYTPPITICLSYQEGQFEHEDQLRLFHLEGGVWVDVTTSLDMVNNKIYGQVSSLSLFTLAEPVIEPTTLVLNSVSPASVTVGSSGPVVLTATLTRNDTSAGVTGATVGFSVDGNSVGTAVTGAGGVGTLNYDPSALAPGSHTVQASFAGETIGGITFEASTSNTLALKCVYNFIGFLPPVDNPPVFNAAKAGRTIPVKWQLKDANGAFISSLSVVVYNPLRYWQIADDGAPVDPLPIDATTTGGTVLRYDSAANQFVFNWQTSSTFAGKCFELLLDLNDGTQHAARFKFTR